MVTALPAPSRMILRLLAALMLLAGPTLTAWNLLAPSFGKTPLQYGRPLAGVIVDRPLVWSWTAFKDGGLQKAVSDRVTDAIPVRRFLVRLNNQLRFFLFGATSADILVGKQGQLIQSSYVREYCARSEGLGAARAKEVLPKLQDIRSYYRARGSVFIYLVTPSKIAHLPHYFTGSFPCPSTEAARSRFVPEFVSTLRAAGIAVVDAASLVHELKDRVGMEMFPPSGVHWNKLGAAEATLALIAEVNRQAQRELLPKLALSYTMTSPLDGSDRELAELLNVLTPPVSYQVPKIRLEPERPCVKRGSRSINAAIIGSSFGHAPAELLIENGCVPDLKLFFYFRLNTFGGTPYRSLHDTPTEDDLARLPQAEIMILEENESFLGQTSYLEALWRVIQP